MLSDERIDAVYREVWSAVVHSKRLSAYARAIEREAIANFLSESGQYLTNDASREAAVCEATAPLIKQIKQLSDQADRAVSVAEGLDKKIKKDEALMRDVLEVLSFGHPAQYVMEMQQKTCERLRQRLEAKK